MNAAQLASAGGLVRCGNCSCQFNALDQLFDYWPDSHSKPAAASTPPAPPVLGGSFENDTGADDQAQAGVETLPPDPNRNWWLAVLVLLGLTTLANLAWTFKEPLLENPTVRTWLIEKGWLNSELMEELSVQPSRDLAMLHLVSRDMHQHPTRAGMLALSVIFVNRAAQAQPYPVIRVSLMNAANELLARRRFSADEYLPQSAEPQRGMPPNVHIPILLEFVDPGAGATGFELEFE